MAGNYLFWKRYVIDAVLPGFDLLQEYYQREITPSFENLEKRAEEVSQEAWQRIMSQPGEPVHDPAFYAESAWEEGLNWFIDMAELRHDLNGLFCVAIWSRIEKYLGLLFTREILPWYKDTTEYERLLWRTICDEYRKVGIHLNGVQPFEHIDVLRLVNNAVKHGQGHSLKKLRGRKPEMVSADRVVIEEPFVRSAFDNARAYVTEVTEKLKDTGIT